MGWAIQTESLGKVLVVRRTPRTISVTTSKATFSSINQSITDAEAGWSLDDALVRAIRDDEIDRVAVWVPKSGAVYMTDAKNYLNPDGYNLVLKNKTSGDRLRCVGFQSFTRHPYKPTSLRIATQRKRNSETHATAGP